MVEHDSLLLFKEFLLADAHLIGCRNRGIACLSNDKYHQTFKFIEIQIDLSRSIFNVKVMNHNGSIRVLFHRADKPDLRHVILCKDKSLGSPR